MLANLFEVMELRDLLIREIDAGYYDALSWDALLIMAREAGCLAIADQVQGYIKAYGRNGEQVKIR
jgi:hypothetical protein